jgi:hypothetical protein
MKQNIPHFKRISKIVFQEFIEEYIPFYSIKN